MNPNYPKPNGLFDAIVYWEGKDGLRRNAAHSAFLQIGGNDYESAT